MSGVRQSRVQRREFEAVMRRIYSLPTIWQLRAYTTLRDYLAGEMTPETAADRQLRLRAEALDAMRRVAEHLGLPDDVAPKATEWRALPPNVVPGWSATRVGEAWGRFRFAQQAYRGEKTSVSAAQRSVRRSSRRRTRAHETYLAGARLWLATDSKSITKEDYDEFVHEHNDDVQAGRRDGLPLVAADSVEHGTRLQWADILAVVRDGVDVEAVRAARIKERLARDYGPLNLISGGTVELMLDLTEQVSAFRVRHAFPAPVVKLGRTCGWVQADVMAFKRRGAVTRRHEGEMQHLVMDTTEVAQKFDYKNNNSVVALLHAKSPGVPRPDGRLGGAYYWMRENVEAWLKAEQGTRRRVLPSR